MTVACSFAFFFFFFLKGFNGANLKTLIVRKCCF